MSSKTASGAQGERQVTAPLHDDLGLLHYKLTVTGMIGYTMWAFVHVLYLV